MQKTKMEYIHLINNRRKASKCYIEFVIDSFQIVNDNDEQTNKFQHQFQCAIDLKKKRLIVDIDTFIAIDLFWGLPY